jgi:hypothetical protein
MEYMKLKEDSGHYPTSKLIFKRIYRQEKVNSRRGFLLLSGIFICRGLDLILYGFIYCTGCSQMELKHC